MVIITDNPAFFNGTDLTTSTNLMGTCVAVMIGWISISTHYCFIRKWLRKSLGAFAPVNAHSIWVSMYPARPMYRDFGNDGIEMWLSNWIRELSTDNSVNLSWCSRFGSSTNKNEKGHMGVGILLELNGADMCHCPSKDSLFSDFIQEGLHIEIEHMCNNIRALTPNLPREQSHLNILPLGVGSCSNKMVWFGPKGSSNGI